MPHLDEGVVVHRALPDCTPPAGHPLLLMVEQRQQLCPDDGVGILKHPAHGKVPAPPHSRQPTTRLRPSLADALKRSLRRGGGTSTHLGSCHALVVMPGTQCGGRW